MKAASRFASAGACIVGSTSNRQGLNEYAVTVKLLELLGELVTESRTHAAPSPCIAVVRTRLATDDLCESWSTQYGEACINTQVQGQGLLLRDRRTSAVAPMRDRAHDGDG